MRFDRTGLDRLIRHLDKVASPNPWPLLDATVLIMDEDNRRGILAGTDGTGGYMLAVTYRPKTKPIGIRSNKAASFRNNAAPRRRVGTFAGFGRFAAGLNNNLTTQQYQQLSGPPLAPRGVFSRVITNYNLAPFIGGPLSFGVVGTWIDVVSTKGIPFLNAHFEGLNGLPKRDLRGIRPEGMRKIRRTFIAWASDQIRYEPHKVA